jgi:hypothetical protein
MLDDDAETGAAYTARAGAQSVLRRTAAASPARRKSAGAAIARCAGRGANPAPAASPRECEAACRIARARAASADRIGAARKRSRTLANSAAADAA